MKKTPLKTNPCSVCSSKFHTSFNCPRRFRKPINTLGRRGMAYRKWRDEVAIPYLKEQFGYVCNGCQGQKCGNKYLEVDHILNRGSNPHLIMELSNIQFLGRYPCHIEKTNRAKRGSTI